MKEGVYGHEEAKVFSASRAGTLETQIALNGVWKKPNTLFFN